MSFGSAYFTLPKFKYVKPRTVDELLDYLSKYGSNAKIMSGGVGLIAFMKERLISPEYIISLFSIPELKKIKYNEETFEIGANVHLSELESDLIHKTVPTLYKAVKNIADPTIRNMGTLVGDLAEAIPWADAYPALLSLDASLEIMKKGSGRKVPVNGFVEGLGQINLKEDEFISKIILPIRKMHGTYIKFANSSEYGLATVALTYLYEEERFNLVLGSITEKPIVINNADVGWDFKSDLSKNIEKLNAFIDSNVNPVDDLLSSSKFRKNIIK
jgi:Aerobic-type carbon monoxide dehydrogenase, middle subunit CoxM/CutM homologs